MVDRRRSDRRNVICEPRNPICMTIGFMFGIIVGSLIHTEHSMLSVITSVIMATAVFHFTFARSINFTEVFSKVIKKGS